MLFTVTRMRDWNYKGAVEIKTLADLLLFMEFNKSDISIYKHCEVRTNSDGDNEKIVSYEICLDD